MNQLAEHYSAGQRDAAEGKPRRPQAKGEKRLLRRAYLTGYQNEKGRVRRTRRYSQLHLGLAALALASLCTIATPAAARSPRPWSAPATTLKRVRFTIPATQANCVGCCTGDSASHSWQTPEVAVQRRALDWARPVFDPVLIAVGVESRPGAPCTLWVERQQPGDVLLVRTRSVAGVSCWPWRPIEGH